MEESARAVAAAPKVNAESAIAYRDYFLNAPEADAGRSCGGGE